MSKQYYRQGDVMVKRVGDNPAELKENPAAVEMKAPLTVRHGEVTGHSHRVLFDSDQPGLAVLEPETEGNNRGFDLPSAFATEAPVELIHDEHDTIVLPPGLYDTDIRQVEYEGPEITRQVTD